MNELVTIVIPAYNAAGTIARAIESVRAQTEERWELVIVDDGSFDETAARASEIADPRVRVISTRHDGVCAARNTGIASSAGTIVTFLDADDEAHPDWIRTFIERFEANDRIGTVCCGMVRVVGDQETVLHPEPGDGLLSGQTALFLSGSYAVRRNVLDRVGVFTTSLAFGENTDLGHRIVLSANSGSFEITSVDRPLVRWNVDPRRNDVRDEARLHAAEHTLTAYAEHLEQRPAEIAKLHRIAAVNAARIGHRRRAIGHGWQALRHRPTSISSWSTLVRTGVPVAAHGWYRPSSGQRPELSSGPSPARVAAQDQPVVSVLMPVYNEPERVGRAIDSVLAQTFDRFELIVVDDGSSDGTSEILSSYADDRRVRLLVNDGNIGLVRSLNRGLAVCRAPLVARLDADDHMEPTRLERQTALFDDDPRLTLSATAYRRVDSAGEFIRLGSPPLDHGGLAVAMLTGNRIQHSSIMFDRAAALGHGGYREAWFPVEDYDLWLRMLRDGKYRGLPSVEVSYTENPDGISSRRAAEQRSKSLARSARYIADLTGRPATQLTADGMTMSDIVRSARSIRRRLRRRGIADGSLERETLTACNGALRDRSRLVRALLVAARSPRAALLGRIGDR